MMWIRLTAVAFMMLVAGLLAGCAAEGGYATGEVYDASIHTVALPIFANRTFYRETEFNLTEAIAKEIESRTPYKVTRSGSADTIIMGTVLSVEKRLLSRDFHAGVTQEAQLAITASFEWKDLRSGKILRKRGRISGVAEFIATAPVGEPEQVARQAAVAELAREIVSVMRTDW
jgi:hypothetical protein